MILKTVSATAPVSTSESVINSVVKQEPPVLDKLVSDITNLFSPKPESVVKEETNMASAPSTSGTIAKSSIDASKSTILAAPAIEGKTTFTVPSLVEANQTFVAASSDKQEPAWLTSYKSQCASRGGSTKLWGVGLYGNVDLAASAKQKLDRDGCVKVGVGSGDYAGQDVYCCPGAASTGKTGSTSSKPPSQFVVVDSGGGSTEVVYDPEAEVWGQGLPSPVGGTQPASPFVRYLIAGGVGAAVGAVGAKVMKKKMTVPTLVGLGLGLAAAWFAGRGQG